jgi:hypothetical protein
MNERTAKAIIVKTKAGRSLLFFLQRILSELDALGAGIPGNAVCRIAEIRDWLSSAQTAAREELKRERI